MDYVEGVGKLIGHAGMIFTPLYENSRTGYCRANPS
jgi:hypothetical protein